MPSWRLFSQQPAAYRQHVLPDAITARVAVEAGITTGWAEMVGLKGEVVGMHRFGASAPGDVLYRKFGITVDAVVRAARSLLQE
jgi:transketolase